MGHGGDKSAPVRKSHGQRGRFFQASANAAAPTPTPPREPQVLPSVKSFASIPQASGSFFWGFVPRKLLSISSVWNP